MSETAEVLASSLPARAREKAPVQASPSPSRKPVFLPYIHSFRGLAILFILAGHCLDLFDWSSAPTLSLLLAIVLQNGSVYFVFIAGYLFQHLSTRYEFKKYVKTKVMNVILPYFLMSLPAIVFFTLVTRKVDLGQSFYQRPLALQVLSFYGTGRHVAAYWFIPMISAFFLMSPLLIYWDRRPRLHWCVLPVLAVSFCVSRTPTVNGYADYLGNCAYFAAPYLLGILFSHYHDRVFGAIARLRFPLVLLVVGCILVELVHIGHKSHPLNLLQKLSLCGLFLYLLREAGEIGRRPLGYLANVSFGLYFVDPYIVAGFRIAGTWVTGVPLLNSEGFGHLANGSVLVLVASFLILVIIAVLWTAAARRFLGRYSRMFVGC